MQRTNGKLGIRVLRTRGRNYHFREINAVPIRIQIVSHREAVFVMPHAEPWFPNSFFELFFLVKIYGEQIFAKPWKAFDDCCPDFEETCVDKSCLKQKGKVSRSCMQKNAILIVVCNLELIEGDNLENYFRSMRLPPPKAKSNGSDRELPSIASGKSNTICLCWIPE